LIHEGVSVFGKTCSEYNQFEVLGHYFEEVVDSGSFLNVDVANVAVDVHWDDVVRVFNLVELTVYQRFIKV
jgi:hypothetical protein